MGEVDDDMTKTIVVALDGLVRFPELRQRLARNGRAMAESLTWDGAVAAREELLWRIHRNEMPTGGLQGFDTGIMDGYGTSFDRLSAEVGAKEGELFEGADDRQYVVESGRLRRVLNASAIGLPSTVTLACLTRWMTTLIDFPVP